MIRVIGCGNPEAGDDGVGLEVVRRVRDLLADTPGIEVEVAGTGARALDLTLGADGLVVVDAVRTPGGGRAPGTVVRVDVGAGGPPLEIASSLSSHGLGLAEVLGLSAAIGFAPRAVFVGVEALGMVPGQGLSPEVRAAVPALVELVVTEARALLRAAAPEPHRALEATR